MGIQVIKSLMTFSFEKKSINKLSEDYQKENIKAIAISSAFNPLIRMGVLAGFLGTMLIGSYMALNGTLEVGSYSVLVFLTQRFLWPFTTLSTLIDDFERSMASTDRIFNMMGIKKNIVNQVDALHPENLKKEICFKDVSFSYNKDEKLFDDFNMTIPYGSSIGIVGDTGSGKSTIAKLLLRLYDPNSGVISIGATPIDKIDISFLRNHMGIVNQNSFLFNATIKDNISYGLKNISMVKIEKAARQSQAMEFIEKFSNGFKTMIGERGQTLSGGQQQRIAIARTIIRDPDIIIFDEATSSVDNKTEQLIQQALFNIQKDRTTIIIAHRLSTIRNCNTIFVIHNGQIVEKGDHIQLVGDESSYYSRLWKIQTGE
tara:strand:- start:825 stop:1943 length:1119 start_codon:yes stop_codon:yes gene_type:complete